MILLDTSIWIDHLRKREEHVEFLLKRKQILVHPFVIGEIALGPMQRYDLVLRSLSELPQVVTASDSEVLAMIREHSLMGSGIGYVDAHLLASASLLESTRLYTRDKRLVRVAVALALSYQP
ncbi:type II toxin-antitoxin system VapC family toxin [Neorhizobium lilium]|uniref:Type II toxin-antitoxin system VapC family toxin n=1 Tax=Neorhizobium lilium TaxID=2503024 RepID=A0A3S3SBC5_9HYPH|nr:type II toxin-antitoxin system VapC family toxin [Neorhizobium lilium]RWX75983.1 type II toxin-antitoxin system VapC family toxin [Neorhizobium lilium]